MSAEAAGLAGVKYIIAVASGKGGVGKSTTAVNLAAAMVADGWRTGLLDADIYGPSQPLMLGKRSAKPDVRDEKSFVPVEAHGIKTMSMGYLVEEKTAMAWRGPMAGGALAQMLEQTLWGELDVLIIDMPPGTGDIQLTLSQKAKVSGAVIVTTPQDIALLDAIKGIEMFSKVSIPVLGIVENMGVHICSNCGHADALFGEGGGERIAAQYNTSLLGSLPLTRELRELADQGVPAVAADAESALAQCYRDVAAKVREALEQSEAQAMPSFSESDD
jgi:ATP-binding protein involved in chromosome partitioning